MNAAVLCGDKWHPAQVVQQGLGPLQDSDIRIDFFVDPQEWSQERTHQYDVLVLSKSNGKSGAQDPKEDRDWLTDELQQCFLNYVQQGGGLLVCHSGTVGYRETPAFLNLVGGVFDHHPPHCEVTLQYSGEFGKSDTDPNTITIHDEHYFVTTTDDIDTFLTSVSANGTQPAGWTRHHGTGRVCVLTPGHFPDVWSHSVYQRTLRHALNWCAGERA